MKWIVSNLPWLFGRLNELRRGMKMTVLMKSMDDAIPLFQRGDDVAMFVTGAFDSRRGMLADPHIHDHETSEYPINPTSGLTAEPKLVAAHMVYRRSLVLDLSGFHCHASSNCEEGIVGQ